MWDAQIPALTDKFCMIRYDTRGHGQSSPAEGPYSFNMLESLDKFFAETGESLMSLPSLFKTTGWVILPFFPIS